MNTILYIMRHADKRDKWGHDYRDLDDLQKNKAVILSVQGEKNAEHLSLHPELNNLDTLWVSDYVRTMQTAKYIAKQNNLDFNIHPDLGERIKGHTSLGKYNFAAKQWQDPDYRSIDGESRNDVFKRMNTIIMRILNAHKGGRIAIVSHTTSMNFWFLNWCQVNLETKNMYYHDKLISHNFKIRRSGLYKLTFDQQLNLLDIEPLTEIYDKINIH